MKSLAKIFFLMVVVIIFVSSCSIQQFQSPSEHETLKTVTESDQTRKDVSFLEDTSIFIQLIIDPITRKLLHPDRSAERRDVRLKLAKTDTLNQLEVNVLKDHSRFSYVQLKYWKNSEWNTVYLNYDHGYNDFKVYLMNSTVEYNNCYFYVKYIRYYYNYFTRRYTSVSTIDDNKGYGYYLNGNDSDTGGNVTLANASYTYRWTLRPRGASTVTYNLNGQIYIDNICHDKRVGIRYTYNNWSTYRNTYATFSHGISGYDADGVPIGVEVWNFDTSFILSAEIDTIEFALFFDNAPFDTEEWRWNWDNNFTHDYSLYEGQSSIY